MSGGVRAQVALQGYPVAGAGGVEHGAGLRMETRCGFVARDDGVFALSVDGDDGQIGRPWHAQHMTRVDALGVQIRDEPLAVCVLTDRRK